MDWSVIITAILGILAIFTSVKWTQLKKVLKEAAEAMSATSAALEDDRLSKDEVASILKEWSELLAAGKKLFSK